MNIAPIAQVRARNRVRPMVIDLRRMRTLLLSAVVLFVVIVVLSVLQFQLLRVRGQR